MQAYCAKPAGGKKLPVVLLVHEIWSVHEYFKDVARRLAKLGYLAVSPDLYQRQGDVTNLPIEEIRKVVATVPDAQVMDDLDATARWAARTAAMPAHGHHRILLGRAHHVALLRAQPGREGGCRLVRAGRQARDRAAAAPSHRRGRRAQVPVLGLYGAEDAGIPNDTVERMRAALASAGKPSEIVLYPGMPHAFHADYRPSYRREAAEDGWKRMLDWFRRHGVA
jgi:carboxymethylenebutenolidase